MNYTELMENIHVVPIPIQKLQTQERNLKKNMYKQRTHELEKVQSQIRSWNNRRSKIIFMFRDLKKTPESERHGLVWNAFLDSFQGKCNSYFTDYFLEGDQKNSEKFQWSSLIKKGIEPHYSQHGKKGERSLDKVRNPEKYMWNRKRDKDGTGSGAGFLVCSNEHWGSKRYKTKGEVGASSYPTSPVKIR